MAPNRPAVPARIGLGLSIILFLVPAAVLWVATRQLTPCLIDRGWHPLLAWFASGALVFGPLLAGAVAGARIAENRLGFSSVLEQLRVRPLTSSDWKLVLCVLAAASAIVAVLQVAVSRFFPALPLGPPFLDVTPLAVNELYILAVWLPFFFLNIVGEELWWRGFIQPRQEPVFGRATWIVQGLLHGIFHVSFGIGVMVLLLPVVFAIPWAVQRSRNTSVGIVIHAGINGPAFLAVSLGLLPG